MDINSRGKIIYNGIICIKAKIVNMKKTIVHMLKKNGSTLPNLVHLVLSLFSLQQGMRDDLALPVESFFPSRGHARRSRITS